MVEAFAVYAWDLRGRDASLTFEPTLPPLPHEHSVVFWVKTRITGGRAKVRRSFDLRFRLEWAGAIGGRACAGELAFAEVASDGRLEALEDSLEDETGGGGTEELLPASAAVIIAYSVYEN